MLKRSHTSLFAAGGFRRHDWVHSGRAYVFRAGMLSQLIIAKIKLWALGFCKRMPTLLRVLAGKPASSKTSRCQTTSYFTDSLSLLSQKHLKPQLLQMRFAAVYFYTLHVRGYIIHQRLRFTLKKCEFSFWIPLAEG